jgi:phosphomannomutase
MAEQLIISISGLRGIVGENLTDSIATDYGCAFGTFLKSKHAIRDKKLSVCPVRGTKISNGVCIGRDSRPSGRMLASAVTAGLCSVGIDVIDLGIVTTPGVSVMVSRLGCVGGVVITASHNPVQYNGIKLLLDNGMAPPADAAGQIRQFFFDRRFTLAESDHYGKVTSNDQTDAVHIAKVLTIVDKEKIAAKRYKVVLDCVNGAGGRVAKKMLAELGCAVSAINDEPTGLFARTPEPLAENLKDLCKVVKAKKADLGLALDPDGDRLAIVDENGTCIGEEYTLALAAKFVFSKILDSRCSSHEPRVTSHELWAATNLSTSRMIDDIAQKAGCKVIRTPVGEANVANAMLKHNCIIGGEGNGGVIDLRVAPVRDALVGMAFALQLMAETGKTISGLVSEIGGYYMTKEKFAATPQQARQILDAAKKTFAGAKVNSDDGLRFDFADGWVHLRTSNTEPVMRLIVEAKDQATAQKYIDAVLKIRREIQV